jgi:hypothetical protein
VPSALKTLSKLAGALGATIVDQELGDDARVGEIIGDAPRLLGDPRRAGMSSRLGDPDPFAVELHEEEYGESLQPHGVDSEEIRGHDA